MQVVNLYYVKASYEYRGFIYIQITGIPLMIKFQICVSQMLIIKATTHICKHETSFTFSYSSSSILLLHFPYSTICVILQINTTYWMSFVAFHFHNTDYAFVYLFTSLTLHFSYFVVIQTSALSSKYRLHCLCIISTIVY